MAKTIQEERWRWLKPIINKEMKLVDIARVCPYSERSLKRWKKAYKEHGMKGLIPKSTRPKTQPNETPIRIKETVIQKRKETMCFKTSLETTKRRLESSDKNNWKDYQRRRFG